MGEKGRRLTQEVLCGVRFIVGVLREMIDLLTHAFKGTWERDIERQLGTRERECAYIHTHSLTHTQTLPSPLTHDVVLLVESCRHYGYKFAGEEVICL